MKKIFSRQFCIFAVSFITLILMKAFAFAQDSAATSSSSTTNTSNSNGVTIQPWMYAVGAAIVLIIIIALIRGNKGGGSGGAHTDQVTYTKTTSSGDNV